ncbi:MAG: hypothetical protein ACM3N0_11410 [Chloroflexota bacterium]
MSRFSRAGLTTVLALFATLLLAAPAPAATVVNGDFESGSLFGWTQVNSGEGAWYAYSGTIAPSEIFEVEPREVPPPPQGKFAAISDQGGPGTHILYQDVAIPLYASSSLSMLVYYKSEAPLVTPSPNTLSAAMESEEELIPNQQYRVDVIKPTAPIETLNPADILATVFATSTGDPQTLSATTMTANLTPFAGQTVRLRLAEVDNQLYLSAGADSIAIPSTPYNKFSFGKLKLNKKKGTATLQVKVPGPGKVVATDVKKHGKRIKNAKTTASGPRTVKLKLKPTAQGKKTLGKKGKLPFKLKVTFTPTGGKAASKKRSGKLKLTR